MEQIMTASAAKMMQASMAANTVKAKLEKVEEDKAKQPKEKTFHEKELDRMAADPENLLHKASIAVGKKNAQEFLDSAMNRHHPQHARNLETFKEKYKMSPKAVEDDEISKAAAENGTREFEKRDIGYEANVLRLYKPVSGMTHMKKAMYDNWAEALQEKWNRCGYNSDEEYCRHSANTYCLSRNENLSDLKEFKLK